MEAHVTATIFISRRDPDATLTLVVYDDETIGIQCNNQPIDDCRWSSRDSDLAVNVYRDLLSQATRKRLGHEAAQRHRKIA